MRKRHSLPLQLALIALAIVGAAALVGAAASPGKPSAQLVIASTVDVKGKTSPCGCSIPKGGFARRASFLDSLRAQDGAVALVDAGGFFPEPNDYEDNAAFMMETMVLLHTDAVGMGEKELRWGRGFLKAQIARTKLPVVCANLLDRQSKKPFVATSLVKKIGSTKVGFFGLMSDKVDTGPSRDSLLVEEPTAAATRTVAALKKQGATVIVLLSQLGKVESEDLVTAVPGIDLVIVGRNVPLLQKGRMILNTLACYGGEQGQYLGVSRLDLSPQGRMTSGVNEMSILDPTVPEHPQVLAAVKGFEEAFNEKLRRKEKERVASQAGAQTSNNGLEVDHFLGAEVCARCHTSEAEQWRTTAHARAWETLVDHKVDARPDCIPCHVVGYQKPGGFKTGDDAAKLADVQCENCHGMGTNHEKYAETRITEATCKGCHDATASPRFDFALFEPHIRHVKPDVLPELPAKPKVSKMVGSATMGSSH